MRRIKFASIDVMNHFDQMYLKNSARGLLLLICLYHLIIYLINFDLICFYIIFLILRKKYQIKELTLLCSNVY